MSGLVPLPPATDGRPPGQYPAYPRHPGMDQERAPGSKTTAIWALVLSIVPIPLAWLAAVILSIIVLRDSKYSRDNGKGMAISALIVVPVWIVVLILAVALNSNHAQRDSSGDVFGGGDVSVIKIRVGDCLVDTPGASAQLTVKLTQCSKPHRQEAYANFDLAKGAFPGQHEVDRLSEGGCFARFKDYVGIDPVKSSLEVVYLRPLEPSWGVTHEVTCLISDGTSSTGSLKDSGTSKS